MNALMTISLTALLATTPFSGAVVSKKIILVQAADCYSIGEQKAEEHGGTLATAIDAVQNGQPVCRVIVLVPGQNGERPKRVEIIVPKG